MVESVVGETATERMKVVVPGAKRMQEGFEVAYLDIGSLRELFDPRQKFGIADGERFVGTESGKHLGRQF